MTMTMCLYWNGMTDSMAKNGHLLIKYIHRFECCEKACLGVRNVKVTFWRFTCRPKLLLWKGICFKAFNCIVGKLEIRNLDFVTYPLNIIFYLLWTLDSPVVARQFNLKNDLGETSFVGREFVSVWRHYCNITYLCWTYFFYKQQQVRELAQGQEQGCASEERPPDHGVRDGRRHLLWVPSWLRGVAGQEVVGDFRRRLPHTHTRRLPGGLEEA